MKRHAIRSAAIVIVLVIAFLPSCQRKKPFHDENELYILIAANISLPYWQEAEAGFEDAARVLGVKAKFEGPTSYSPEEELAAFQAAVKRRPAGILVSPARAELFQAAIDSAVQEGIPVVCMDSDAPESRRVLFVGTDNFRAGTESGKRIAELMHGQGNLVVITIPGQFNLEERLRGANEVFQKFPKLKTVKTINDKGDPRLANDQVAALLEAKEKVDGILCLEASGGSGAAEVLYRLDMIGKIPIVAMDKDPETLDWISRGAITATVAQKPYTMSFYGLRFLDDLHHNVVHEYKDWQSAPASPLPTWVDTGTVVVDAKNLETFRAAQATRRKKLTY